MTGLFVLALVLVVGAIAISLFTAVPERKARERVPYSYMRRRYLMTRAEHDCYKKLVEGLGDEYFIFAQVHLQEVVGEKASRQNWRAARAHIDRKSVDFVLCDKQDISPVLAIELDDWSHNREDRQERDREVERILEEAGLPLLRITDMENLIQRVLIKLNAVS